MLWRLLVAVLLCQVFASVAMAASVALADVSCVSGTLANYEALESNGCTVHGERVSDFAFSTTRRALARACLLNRQDSLTVSIDRSTPAMIWRCG